MQSGSDSSDSRSDSSDSRDDSRSESAEARPRSRGRRTVVLTYLGLSINLLVLVGGVFVPNASLLNIVLLPALGLLAITGLTVNVIAFVFGRLAARSEMPAEGKAACRVCVVVTLLQLLAVLAIIFFGLSVYAGILFQAPRVTKPMATLPAQVDATRPTAVDERPATRSRPESRPTVRENGP